MTLASRTMPPTLGNTTVMGYVFAEKRSSLPNLTIKLAATAKQINTNKPTLTSIERCFAKGHLLRTVAMSGNKPADCRVLIRLNFLRRARCVNAASVQHRDPVSNFVRADHVVCDRN